MVCLCPQHHGTGPHTCPHCGYTPSRCAVNTSPSPRLVPLSPTHPQTDASTTAPAEGEVEVTPFSAENLVAHFTRCTESLDRIPHDAFLSGCAEVEKLLGECNGGGGGGR
jgi:hypothetical protein